MDEKLKKGRQRGSLHRRSLFVSAAFFFSVPSETFVSQKTRQAVYFKSEWFFFAGGFRWIDDTSFGALEVSMIHLFTRLPCLFKQTHTACLAQAVC